MRIIKLKRSEDFLEFIAQFKSVPTLFLILKNQRKSGHIMYRALLANDLDISCLVEDQPVGSIQQIESVIAHHGFRILHGEGCIQEYGRRSDD